MFGWFKNLFGKIVSQKTVETTSEDPLVKKINASIFHLFKFHSRFVNRIQKIENLDNRFYVSETVGNLHFYITYSLGQKRIGRIDEWSKKYESGVWDSDFSMYLDELISKCKELEEKEIQEQKIADENREKAINKLFQKGV